MIFVVVDLVLNNYMETWRTFGGLNEYWPLKISIRARIAKWPVLLVLPLGDKFTKAAHITQTQCLNTAALYLFLCIQVTADSTLS